MDLHELETIVEGILFASGDPVSMEKLCLVLGLELDDLDKVILSLSDYYSFNRRGIQLVRLDNSVQLVSRPEHAEYIRAALETRRPPLLSNAALEVLSIVAYKQPVTRAYIEQVRSVDSSNTVVNLVEKGLIQECGRLDVPGRPHLYKTTPAFLRSFGLKSINELPNIEKDIEGEEGEQLSLLLSSQPIEQLSL